VALRWSTPGGLRYPSLGTEGIHKIQRRSLLLPVAFFMESLDTTILNTAVPAIAQALKVAPLSMKAVLASYTLSLAVYRVRPPGWKRGQKGSLYGSKRSNSFFTTP
jgi:hypothetical protein